MYKVRIAFPRRAALLLLVLSLLLLTGCSDDDNGVNPPATSSETEIIAGAADDWLSSGSAPVMLSSTLYTTLNDGIPSNDPFILDIRSASDYAAGHIPGAVNVAYREVAKSSNASVYPTDRKIVVVCYTGHTASQVTAWLGAMGYDATCLKFGMSSWTLDTVYNPSVLTNRPFDVDVDCGDYPVSTSPATAGSYTPPTVENTSSNDEQTIIRTAADVYLSSGASPVITSANVYLNLNDGNSANDPVLLDIRGAADYAAGHVAGAINVPFREVAKDANLAKLDPGKQIVVICYTGHTASQATMLLNMLGYNAAAMKFGMTSWTVDPAKNPSITTNRYYDPDQDCGNYPCESNPI
ncbi:MAG: hypothetical protein Kow0074_24600 [Candidatus Zixiibacteriota bacterium]